jgi:hypothetical protein
MLHCNEECSKYICHWKDGTTGTDLCVCVCVYVCVCVCVYVCVCVCVCEVNNIDKSRKKSPELNPLPLCLWVNLKIPSAFSSKRKRRHTSPTYFGCVSNYSQPPGDLRNGATPHDRM